MVRFLEGAVRGSVVGAGVGAGLGLFDVFRSLAGAGPGIPPERLLEITLWYTPLLAALGLVLGAVLALFMKRPARTATGLIIAGAAWFGLLGTVLTAWRPGIFHPLSLLAATALLAGAVWLARRIGRSPRRIEHPLPWLAVVVVVLALGLVFRSGPRAPGAAVPVGVSEKHPSVLVVLCDTLRADHTTIGKYERDTTPNLARFAEDALVFTRARSSSPWTKASMASLFTGLAPGVHRTERFLDSLPDPAVTIAEVLSAAGYATGLFSDNSFVSPDFGLDQGFDQVFHRLGRPSGAGLRVPRDSLLGRTLRTSATLTEHWVEWRPRRDSSGEWGAPKVTEEFLVWLDALPADRPFFAHLHYMEPHIPYDPPAPFDARFGDPDRKFTDPLHLDRGLAPFLDGEPVPEEERLAMVDAYDAEILWWDHCFGELLAALESRGIFDDLVIVVTSDHGEGFYEHRLWEHRNGLYEELVRVPLVVRAPGVPVGRIPFAVCLDGVAETLVRLAGFEPPPRMSLSGHALLPAPPGDRETRLRLRVRELISLSEVTNGTKWILSQEGGRESLRCYDLLKDPGETRDLAEKRPEEGQKVRERLLRRAKQEERIALEAGAVQVDERLDKLLKSHGYLK